MTKRSTFKICIDLVAFIFVLSFPLSLWAEIELPWVTLKSSTLDLATLIALWVMVPSIVGFIWLEVSYSEIVSTKFKPMKFSYLRWLYLIAGILIPVSMMKLAK